MQQYEKDWLELVPARLKRGKCWERSRPAGRTGHSRGRATEDRWCSGPGRGVSGGAVVHSTGCLTQTNGYFLTAGDSAAMEKPTLGES